jgi:hypothetical protein
LEPPDSHQNGEADKGKKYDDFFLLHLIRPKVTDNPFIEPNRILLLTPKQVQFNEMQQGSALSRWSLDRCDKVGRASLRSTVQVARGWLQPFIFFANNL